MIIDQFETVQLQMLPLRSLEMGIRSVILIRFKWLYLSF